MFGLFKADICIIDVVKRAALSKLLLDNVSSTAPGQTLDEKLASLALHLDVNGNEQRMRTFHLLSIISELSLVPPPSTDDFAWWEGPAHPNGLVPLSEFHNHTAARTNPFDSDDDSSPIESVDMSDSPSQSSSDEELYEHAVKALQTPMAPTHPIPKQATFKKPPPPAPPPRSTKPLVNINVSEAD